MKAAKKAVMAQLVPVNSEPHDLKLRADRAEAANRSLGLHILNLQEALRDGICLMPLEKMGDWTSLTVELLEKMEGIDRQAYKVTMKAKEKEGAE